MDPAYNIPDSHVTIGTPGKYLQIDYRGSDPAYSWTSHSTVSNQHGHDDHAWFFGYNYSPTSDPAKESIGYSFEAAYKPYDGAPYNQSEGYFFFKAPDGTYRRPYMFEARHDTGDIYNRFTGQVVFFGDGYPGEQHWNFESGGRCYVQPGSHFLAGNNALFLQQRMADGTSAATVIYRDNHDVIQIGTGLDKGFYFTGKKVPLPPKATDPASAVVLLNAVRDLLVKLGFGN